MALRALITMDAHVINFLYRTFGSAVSEIDLMNLLQRNGIVSDNAVWWRDVAPCDQENALRWLASNWKAERR